MNREDRNRRLDALLRGSPTALGWTVDRRPLTRRQVRAYLEAIEAGQTNPHAALGAESPGDPLTGRASGLLRRAGLIHYDRRNRRWLPGEAP